MRSASMPSPFRDLVPGPDFPRTAGVGELDAYSHAERSMQMPKLIAFVDIWRKLEKEPFVGVTCDGHCEKGLYGLASEGAPTAAAAAAARNLLSLASGEER